MSLRITVLIPGPRSQLDACRKSLNAMLDDERDLRYRERHTDSRLEYGLTSKTGVPFPPFVNASEEFPALTFSFLWEGLNGESGGRATIEHGGLISRELGGEKSGEGHAGAVHVLAAHDGTIYLAVAMHNQAGDRWIGYAATADQHGYFSWERSGAEPRLVTTTGIADRWETQWALRNDEWAQMALTDDREIPVETLTTLENIANEFAAEWLWFAAENAVDTALERHRFGLYGLVVNPANLRSEKIRALPRDETRGITYSTMQAPQAMVIDALDRCWRIAAS
jgi:hypothetical protein